MGVFLRKWKKERRKKEQREAMLLVNTRAEENSLRRGKA
jgi:hypothetical protein